MHNMKQSLRWVLLLVIFLLVAVPPVSAAPVTQEASTAVTLGTTDILIILFGSAGIVAFLYKRPPSQWDSSLNTSLQERQDNREYMDRLEKAYDKSGQQVKEVVSMFLSGLRIVSPMTGIKADDQLVNFLDDMRTPGAPTLTAEELDKAIFTPTREIADPLTLGGGTGDKQ